MLENEALARIFLSMQSESFIQILRAEYTRRCEKNSQYSLRSYARYLGINVACLSVILKGKRPLTSKMIDRLSKKMDLTPYQMQKVNGLSDNQFELLTLDVYAVVSLWYHDAILELVHTKGFKPELKWIAKRLGITPTEVSLAVERLVRFEMLETSEKKWVVKKLYRNFVTNEFTTAALKRVQQKTLELSQHALENHDVANRYHSQMTMAIRTQDLAEAKKMLRAFREKFSFKMQKGKSNLDDVYQLALSFYSITDKYEGDSDEN